MDFLGVIVILIFFLFIYPLINLSKKTVKDNPVDFPEKEPEIEHLDDLLRRLLKQGDECPFVEEVEKEIKPCVTPKPKKPAKVKPAKVKSASTQVKETTVKKKTNSISTQQPQQGLSIHTKGELRRAILYSEIIRRKY